MTVKSVKTVFHLAPPEDNRGSFHNYVWVESWDDLMLHLQVYGV